MLTRVALQCRKVRSPQVHRIFEHQQLRSLNLAFIDHICDEAFLSLQESGMLAFDTTDLTQSLPADPEAVAAPPKSPSPLQRLNLGKCRITDVTLLRLNFLVHLEEVQLQWCCGVTDAGVASLVRHSPQLRHVDLQSCSAIGDGAVRAVADHCLQLRFLNLSWCQGFTSSALLYLAARCSERSQPAGEEDSPPARHLQRLNLVWCPQVDDGVLRSLSSISTLQCVELLGCADVTSEGLASLTSRGIHYTS